MKTTKEDWIGDCQEHLRTLSKENNSFRPLSSLYSITKPDAVKLEYYLSQCLYHERRLRETVAKYEGALKHVRDSFWSEGEALSERVTYLQEYAASIVGKKL
jgi:hypothetical protein